MAKPSGFAAGFGPGFGVGKYHYALAQYAWNTTPPRPRWELPSGVVGQVDLRPLPAQAAAGGTPAGYAFVTSMQPVGGVELAHSLHMDDTQATTAIRDAWETAVGYRPNGATLNDLLWDQMTTGGDPAGAAGPKPLMPGYDNGLRMSVGGHSVVRTQIFRWGEHPHTEKVREVLRRDFERLWEESNGADYCLRVLDLNRKRFNLSGDGWKVLVPARLLPHVRGPLPHATTITESFNTADSDTLGPNLTWAETEGDTDVVSNKASANGGNKCRAESNLSSDNHYSQAKVGTDASGNGYPGVNCRYATGAVTFYYVETYFAEDAVFYGKMVAGSATNFTSSGQTLNVGTEYTARIQADGSTISAHLEGSEILSTTDTAITGNVRCGFHGFKGGAGFNTWDDFAASDLQPDPSRLLWRRTVRPAPFFPGIGR